MENKKNHLRVILSFLKMGAISFGGGAALLPIFERELVENKQWMDKNNFDVSAIISSISPASLPVSFCAVWNPRYSLVSAFAYTFPGPLIYLALLTGFSYIGEAGTKYLQFISVGLIAFILFVIFRFIRKKRQHISVMITAFLLTSGTVLRRFLLMFFGLKLPTPIFSINMLTLMIVTFFVILFVGSTKSKIKLFAALLIAGFYALLNGKAGILRQLSFPILILMIVLAAVSILYDSARKRGEKTEKAPFKLDYRPIRNLLLFVMIATAFTAMIYFVSQDPNVWDYTGKVVSSSLTSFGGGEVYIGISEATFVQTGFIPEHAFITKIIGIANTLPGPILVHIITGIGYIYGSAAHGVGFGWLFGILGLVLAVSVTAVGALTLSVFFEILKDSSRLHMLIQYIMPVVCGTLISIALSLLIQASSVLTGIGANVFVSAGIVLTIFFTMILLYKKFRLNDLWLLFLGGVWTVLILFAVSCSVNDKPNDPSLYPAHDDINTSTVLTVACLNYHENIANVAKKFMEKYPHVTVIIHDGYENINAYAEAMDEMMANGTLPDIFEACTINYTNL